MKSYVEPYYTTQRKVGLIWLKRGGGGEGGAASILPTWQAPYIPHGKLKGPSVEPQSSKELGKTLTCIIKLKLPFILPSTQRTSTESPLCARCC